MLHELVFLRCHSQFSSYPYTFAPYSYSCKILQPCVEATARVHSDAVLSSTAALLMKTVMKNNCQQQMVHFCFGRILLPDTCESAFRPFIIHLPMLSIFNLQTFHNNLLFSHELLHYYRLVILVQL